MRACAESAHYHQRVRAALPQWRAKGASTAVCKWIDEGVQMNFIGGRAPEPFKFDNYEPLTDEQETFMKGERQRLIDVGAWEETTDDSFVSPMFLVPKKDGGWSSTCGTSTSTAWSSSACTRR